MAKTILLTTTPANCTSVTGLHGVKIKAVTTEPSGTNIKFAVQLDSGNWQKWGGSSWTPLSTQAITGASLAAEGNTATELGSADASSFSSAKTINIAAALTVGSKGELPTISSFDIEGTTGGVLTAKTILSDAITLTRTGKAVSIIDITADTAATNGGSVDVLASIQDDNGSWQDYVAYKSLVTTPEKKAKAIKFKAVLHAPTPGVSTAQLVSVTVKHRTDNIAVLSEGTGVCISKTYNFVNNITRAHLILKHPVVPDTDFTAAVSLRKPATTVTGEVLGTGDGASHTYILKNKTGLASHGFILYFDGVKQDPATYSFSPNDGQVTCTANTGVAITADYIYGWTAEQFQEMTHDTAYPDKQDNSIVFDQFDYLAVKPTDLRGSIGCVRVNIIQNTGKVVDEALGTGTGTLQSFKLKHHAKIETIDVKPAGAKWTYRDNTDVLQVTAAVGQPISVSYSWAARPTYIDDLSCFFNE